MSAGTSLTFTVHDEVPPDVRSAVNSRLYEANQAAARLDEIRGLSCVGRLATGEIVGGVVGRTWGLCCEVEQLWVHAEYRRRGVGTRLMRDLHRRAEGRGCRTFYLETMSFQAPGLYRALGYETRLEIGGFSDGHSKHFMVREVPTGGASSPGKAADRPGERAKGDVRRLPPRRPAR
jgi:ribosomal protein S18 acetylase RimI-like enzyme